MKSIGGADAPSFPPNCGRSVWTKDDQKTNFKFQSPINPILFCKPFTTAQSVAVGNVPTQASVVNQSDGVPLASLPGTTRDQASRDARHNPVDRPVTGPYVNLVFLPPGMWGKEIIPKPKTHERYHPPMWQPTCCGKGVEMEEPIGSMGWKVCHS